jgi:hypothetical protein
MKNDNSTRLLTCSCQDQAVMIQDTYTCSIVR